VVEGGAGEKSFTASGWREYARAWTRSTRRRCSPNRSRQNSRKSRRHDFRSFVEPAEGIGQAGVGITTGKNRRRGAKAPRLCAAHLLGAHAQLMPTLSNGAPRRIQNASMVWPESVRPAQVNEWSRTPQGQAFSRCPRNTAGAAKIAALPLSVSKWFPPAAGQRPRPQGRGSARNRASRNWVEGHGAGGGAGEFSCDAEAVRLVVPRDPATQHGSRGILAPQLVGGTAAPLAPRRG